MSIDTPSWVKDAIFYQIFPDRFAKSDQVAKPTYIQNWGDTPTYHAFQGGDLLGVAERLDYLADLGINAIYFTPVFASTANHRYHTYDYYQIDPILGGNKAFKQLLEAAHARKIRVILDGVFNHASRGFFQFNHLLENGEESPYKDWFHPYAWPLNAYKKDTKPNYEAWWGMPALPKFNTNTPAVREFLWNVATYWLEQGIDGWRLDVPGDIDDDEFWREFRRRCRAVNPDCYIVGELWDDAQRWLQGDQFDAQMNYPFTRASLSFFGGDNLDQSQTAETGYHTLPTYNATTFASEMNRIFNHSYDPEIVFAQMNLLGSHDTPRLLTLLKENIPQTKMIFASLFTVPGAPCIYYGDEIGMTGKHDPLNRAAFPWHQPTSWNEELHTFIQQLIQLRHQSVALRHGALKMTQTVGETAVIYERVIDSHLALIAFNNGPDPVKFSWHPQHGAHLYEQLVPNATPFLPHSTAHLDPYSFRIWTTSL